MEMSTIVSTLASLSVLRLTSVLVLSQFVDSDG